MIYCTYLRKEDVMKILNISMAEVEELINNNDLEIEIFVDGEIRVLFGSVIKYKRRQDCN